MRGAQSRSPACGHVGRGGPGRRAAFRRGGHRELRPLAKSTRAGAPANPSAHTCSRAPTQRELRHLPARRAPRRPVPRAPPHASDPGQARPRPTRPVRWPPPSPTRMKILSDNARPRLVEIAASDDDRVVAPAGTLVFARPCVKRTAVAEEPETRIIAVGGTPGK